MAVLVDLAAFNGPSSNNITSQNYTPFNLGSGSNGTLNRALVVAVVFTGKGAGVSSGLSATYDGVAMTQLTSASNGVGGELYLFGLRNPNTGSKVLALSWTGGNQIMVASLSLVGVNQTSDALAFPTAHRTTATGSTSPNSIAITSASGNIAFAGHTTGQNYTTGSGTDIGHNNTGTVSSGASNYSASANPTVTYASSNGAWASVGCEIAAVATGGPFPHFLRRSMSGGMIEMGA